MILKVLEKRLETNKYFSLILEKSVNFSFYPGQYLDIRLPVNDKHGSTRTFTIASSPTEDFLMVTTKTGVSKFKKMMEKLKRRATVTTAHPAGTFTLDESTPAIFIAGGIGITPFRSMIKYAVDKKLTFPITLIYSNSDNNFLFKEVLDQWQNQLPNLKIIYHNTRQQDHLNRTQLTTIVQMYGNPIYYLAGPPGFVNSMEEKLLQLEVDKTNIRTDRFDGY
ncbi:FAD-dependent oxidoreductase [Candidatus Daviesbacteria bacterium]|nr:FAD-dependent oxidoreductase [Candidatus Daviesbacteria bacterium]